MSGAQSRLSKLAAHFLPASSSPTPPDPPNPEYKHHYNYHTLSPTFFLPRAAAIEPDVSSWTSFPQKCHLMSTELTALALQAVAIYHVTANNKVLRRSYQEAADRARGLAYYLKKYKFKKVGILCPNTPAFLESIFGIAAAGAINVGQSMALRRYSHRGFY